MLNWIWLAMLVVAVIVGGFTGRLPQLMDGAFTGAEKAVMKVALPLLGVWAIWLGIMRLAERSGLVQALARVLRPVLRRLFPEVPAEHPAMGAMVMNMSANMLGLGNAATPLGLRAMRLLESLNPRPGVATNAMVTFLALNTASIQLLPLMAISILATAGAKGATAIVITSFLSTVCAASAGVAVSKLLENRGAFRLEPALPPTQATTFAEPAEVGSEPEVALAPALQPLTRAGRLALAGFAALFLALFVLLLFPQAIEALLQSFNPAWHAPLPPAEQVGKPLWMRALMSASLLAVPFLLSFFPLYAALRGVAVYEQFVEGAHESWETAKRTVPYLVAMLVAIGMLQGAGVVDLLTQALAGPLSRIGFPSELVPLVLIRPLSGSAAKSVFIELVQRLAEPDGFVSRLAGTIYGSTETTFYVLAVYFGSVAIRRTRHAVAAGLTADIVAVVAATIFCTLLLR